MPTRVPGEADEVTAQGQDVGGEVAAIIGTRTAVSVISVCTWGRESSCGLVLLYFLGDARDANRATSRVGHAYARAGPGGEQGDRPGTRRRWRGGSEGYVVSLRYREQGLVAKVLHRLNCSTLRSI